MSACCTLVIALSTPSAAAAEAATPAASMTTAQAPNSATVTNIKVNGQFAEMLLLDTNTNGFLAASKDEVANTSALDFSYAFIDPANPDQAILIAGAGEIPNSAFTITTTARVTTAHLAMTTTFPIIRCVLNLITADFACAPGTPSSFDLTWVPNGLGTSSANTTQVDTFGPVTTRIKGTFTSKTTNVNGTWDAHRATNLAGSVLNTDSSTMTRQITVAPNP